MGRKLFASLAFLLLSANGAGAFDLEYVAASAEIFAEPHDLVLSPDRLHLYVSDNGNDRIAVLDPKTLALLGTFGEDEVGAPHDAAFDAAGRLLVADTDNSRIAIYAVEGPRAKLVGEIRGGISRPEGVTVHPNGRVYATGAGSGNIVAFENGRPVAEAGGLSSPHDVAIAADGTVWIADAANDRLVQMTEDLKTLRTVEGGDYAFSGPRYLGFDAKGRLYVADKYTHRIKVLGPNLDVVLVIGGSGKGPGKFDRPEGIAIDGADIWFSDTYNDRIVRYRIVE